ncbi:hypothetical protein FIBSPDRAFT_742497 [Athelia psychrophila]|uniref:Fe2OG dioxygenase domain-containing protein n=1 Tax=Athelia psychrophila TaxID=1759441 RepID=A0A166J080_9AGAM|nr:hypothetical protein FIBSPDRAFT_742497 [Fibularhizoctonia sp. CBS 109695]
MNGLASPAPSRFSDGSYGSPLPFGRSPSMSDFEVERVPRQSSTNQKRHVNRRSTAEYDTEQVLRASVSQLLASTTRPFTVSGRIPLDPAALVLFFRSKSGITHSLDFPIDVDYDTPPALDVLISACRPNAADYNDFPDRESLFYPTNLPLTATLELANHPVLDAIRSTLFPELPAGHYLTALRDKLEVIVEGGRMGPHMHARPKDGRAATICVTLPVRFKGGALVIRDADGLEEKYFGRGGKTGDMEWTAFLPDCDYEVETVQKGCRLTISYGVHLRTFGVAGPQADPLITPSDIFLDMLSPILNICRGRKIAFYSQADYGVNPSEVLAESLVPNLKGGDALLYHAMKIYKLAPELHWYAGGYIWPKDLPVAVSGEIAEDPLTPQAPPVRGAFQYDNPDEPADDLRTRVEQSGAVLLSEADITILSDWQGVGAVSKERVPFISQGELEKLVVNILLVVFVP